MSHDWQTVQPRTGDAMPEIFILLGVVLLLAIWLQRRAEAQARREELERMVTRALRRYRGEP